MHTRSHLVDQLRALGLARGDTVMVHAGLRAVGPVAGGPDEVHLAIKDVVTPDGTMVMFASCPDLVDDIGRGRLTPAQEAEVREKLPVFDPHTARSSRDNGALVELLRTYPGSRVNEHVARFVVWGKHTELLIAPQPWDFAFGHGSLLERFMELDGKILLLGSDHDTVTFLHYTEHVADFPDKQIVRFEVPVLENGARVWKLMAEYDSSRGAHANWTGRFFAELTDTYLRTTGNDGGLVGSAHSHLMSARGLHAFAERAMIAVAHDTSAVRSYTETV
jgi:aminoglycoside 3-N-acetyltransferase